MIAIMRPSRSVLSIPGSNARMIERGLASDADAAFLDLEDAVAPAAKNDARALVIDAINHGDWGQKARTVRINAIGTPWFARDMVDLLEQTGDRLDLLIVPKVDSAADVHALDRLLIGLESATARSTPVKLEAQIETAKGLSAANAIAGASSRVESLVYGPGDLAASLRMPGLGIGIESEWDAAYGGDRNHHVMLTILIAARAASLRAIDGPIADFRDLDRVRASAMRSRSLGYDGKWCIHPAQIEVVNDVFSPTEQEMQHAAKVVAAWEASRDGALVHEGVMIDAANVRMAQATLNAGRFRDNK
jgi:citrate lyase subunit beta/citryl-CoA lyase